MLRLHDFRYKLLLAQDIPDFTLGAVLFCSQGPPVLHGIKDVQDAHGCSPTGTEQHC